MQAAVEEHDHKRRGLRRNPHAVRGAPCSMPMRAMCLRRRRGGRRKAKLREQRGEVVVVPILDDEPARIELSNRCPSNTKGAAGRGNAGQRPIVRLEHDPFVRVVAAAMKSDTTSNLKSLDDLVASSTNFAISEGPCSTRPSATSS